MGMRQGWESVRFCAETYFNSLPSPRRLMRGHCMGLEEASARVREKDARTTTNRVSNERNSALDVCGEGLECIYSPELRVLHVLGKDRPE